MKITPDDIHNRIKSTEFQILDGTTVTVCNITLDNGFSVRGESACVDPADFDQAVGEDLAQKDAFNKLWPLFGFLRKEENYRDDLRPMSELMVWHDRADNPPIEAGECFVVVQDAEGEKITEIDFFVEENERFACEEVDPAAPAIPAAKVLLWAAIQIPNLPPQASKA